MKKENSPPTAEQIIRRRKLRAETAQDTLQLLLRVLLLGLIAWLFFTQCFLLMRAQGTEMFPAVQDGDLVFACRLQRDYAKDDVVVFREPDGTRAVGRVVALAGDVVTIDDTGTLRVNGTVQEGEILYPTYAADTAEYPLSIPENGCFILKDYRIEAEDSRDYGIVSMDDVEAKVISLLRRRNL